MTNWPLLGSPFQIRSVRLRNRFVFQPHFTALGTDSGEPTDDHVAYHEERARGGAGLIIFESQAVHGTGKMSRRFVDAWRPDNIPPALANKRDSFSWVVMRRQRAFRSCSRPIGCTAATARIRGR